MQFNADISTFMQKVKEESERGNLKSSFLRLKKLHLPIKLIIKAKDTLIKLKSLLNFYATSLGVRITLRVQIFPRVKAYSFNCILKEKPFSKFNFKFLTP